MIGHRHVPTPAVGSAATLLTALVGVGAGLLLSWRQLRLHRISGRKACLAASLSLVSLAASGLVWVDAVPFTAAWWFAHGLDVFGVLGAAAALAVGYRPRQGVAEVLAPVLSREPLAALELGFSPLVHAFVADLETKDTITRDHVIRVGELAVRTGLGLGLSPQRLRRLGTGAILHDVGKLAIPDDILKKPGGLDDEEAAIMRSHTEHGHRLLAGAPELADAAGLVRSHHERPDGAGYPDGLQGSQIPLDAAIISVCDAFDAMANTRQYRAGLGTDRAIAILREHSGRQWVPGAVDAVIAVLPEQTERPPTFDAVGRHPAPSEDGCESLAASA